MSILLARVKRVDQSGLLLDLFLFSLISWLMAKRQVHYQQSIRNAGLPPMPDWHQMFGMAYPTPNVCLGLGLVCPLSENHSALCFFILRISLDRQTIPAAYDALSNPCLVETNNNGSQQTALLLHKDSQSALLLYFTCSSPGNNSTANSASNLAKLTKKKLWHVLDSCLDS